MFSHTPAFVHARKRLYTLCHGPNRSGRSRHGTPVFSQYSIALSISRLLFPGRPPCGFLSGGNSSLIFFHFSSLISCRLMCPILSLLSALLNTQVLKQALGRRPGRPSHCARRRVSERNCPEGAALSAERLCSFLFAIKKERRSLLAPHNLTCKYTPVGCFATSAPFVQSCPLGRFATAG